MQWAQTKCLMLAKLTTKHDPKV
ncbi:hypothetical protein DSUL_40037 [Desulfovibrionales bacterium]